MLNLYRDDPTTPFPLPLPPFPTPIPLPLFNTLKIDSSFFLGMPRVPPSRFYDVLSKYEGTLDVKNRGLDVVETYKAVLNEDIQKGGGVPPLPH